MTIEVVQSWFLGVAGTASLAAAAQRGVAFRRRPEPVRGYLAVGLGSVGLALVLNIEAVGGRLDRSVFVTPNASILVSQLLVAVDAWASVEMVLASAGRSERRQRSYRLTSLAIAWLALIVTSSRTLGTDEMAVTDLFARTAHLESWRPYWVVFGLIALIPCTFLAVSAARYARDADLWLARGLRVVAVGSALCATFGLFLTYAVFGHASSTVATAQMCVVGAGCLLVAAGCAAPHLSDVRARWVLMPTWKALTAIYPAVRSGDRPDLRRLVTEVQDCVVVARGHDELTSPLIRAIADLPLRAADRFDLSVQDMMNVARRRLSPVWEEEPSTLDVVHGT